MQIAHAGSVHSTEQLKEQEHVEVAPESTAQTQARVAPSVAPQTQLTQSSVYPVLFGSILLILATALFILLIRNLVPKK